TFPLLHRLPPCSTLFPYTTLFRSKPPRCPTMNIAANTAAIPRLVTYANNNPIVANQPGGRAFNVSNICRARCASILFVAIFGRRSEEHTSELQSRENLVCRLLLEK